MDSYRIYSTGSVLLANARVPVQEASLALLLVRPVLLLQYPQLYLHLAATVKFGPICGLLLSVTWIPR